MGNALFNLAKGVLDVEKKLMLVNGQATATQRRAIVLRESSDARTCLHELSRGSCINDCFNLCTKYVDLVLGASAFFIL